MLVEWRNLPPTRMRPLETSYSGASVLWKAIALHSLEDSEFDFCIVICTDWEATPHSDLLLPQDEMRDGWHEATECRTSATEGEDGQPSPGC